MLLRTARRLATTLALTALCCCVAGAQVVEPPVAPGLAAVPDPDPDRRLDFNALMGGRASNPAAWPRPFTLDGTTKADLIDLGDGHFVRADRQADRAQLLRAMEPAA